MQVEFGFDGESLTFEVDPKCRTTVWQAPPGMDGAALEGLAESVLEHPLGDYPALRQAVVPGDRVVIALDARFPALDRVLPPLIVALRKAGVEAADLLILCTAPVTKSVQDRVAAVLANSHGNIDGGDAAPLHWSVHDPNDRKQLAYLANTQEGRRIYLNRALIDADFVLPMGRVGFDPYIGECGPWSAMFPDLSDQPTLSDIRQHARFLDQRKIASWNSFQESLEVSWLLGCQYHLAGVPGVGGSGVHRLFLGQADVVREEATKVLAECWTHQVRRRAGLVVAGIQSSDPERPSTFEDLVLGLGQAFSLAQPGGAIVILSRANGSAGPVFNRIASCIRAGQPAAAGWKGQEAEEDYLIARRFAEAAIGSRVYIYSDLDKDLLDDFGIIPLDTAGQSRKLTEKAESCIFLNCANWTLTRVVGESG